MVVRKKFKTFDDSLLNRHPDLKDVLKPNDQYPELMYILKTTNNKLPVGSLNTKVIINDGKIVERVYKTPKGKVVSIFLKSSNTYIDQAA